MASDAPVEHPVVDWATSETEGVCVGPYFCDFIFCLFFFFLKLTKNWNSGVGQED